MRILFNLKSVGLGNNGGSRTLVRCAETLSALGHVVIMYGPNRYRWHKPKGIKFVDSGKMPPADCIIATGYNSVSSTVSSKIRRKYYYIRGYEQWVTSKSNLIRSYRSLSCIVNSEWLRSFLRQHSIKSELVYPGLDEWFYDEGVDREPKIGGLFSNRHKTKRHVDVQSIADQSGFDLVMLNKHLKNATPDQTRSLYNTIMVWLSPSELEGLHNPPIEASLCGCSLVVTDHPRGGTLDFAIHNETALVYPARDTGKASEYVRMLMDDSGLRKRLTVACQELLRDKIGSRKRNMKRLVNILT